MKTKTNALIALACLTIAATGQSAIVNYSWEETGDDVLLTVSGSLDVTGWETGPAYSLNRTGAHLANDYGPPFPPFQTLYFYGHATSPGDRVFLEGGEIVLSPWGDFFPLTYVLDGTHESGDFIGDFGINRYLDTQINIYLQADTIVDGFYEVNGVYRFAGTNLAEMFSDGQEAWRDGALIATFGNNEIHFRVVPEPSISAFLAGAAAFSLVSRRRSRKK